MVAVSPGVPAPRRRSVVAGRAAGAFFAGVGQSAAVVLAYSAAQEEVRDEVLGRVTGSISLVHRGAHATGLVFVAPLFAVAETQAVFAVAAVLVPLIGLAGVAVAARRRGGTVTPGDRRFPYRARYDGRTHAWVTEMRRLRDGG
jgi:hypothetical protein